MTARKQDACGALIYDSGTGRHMIDGTHWLRAVDVQQMCSPVPAASPGRR